MKRSWLLIFPLLLVAVGCSSAAGPAVEGKTYLSTDTTGFELVPGTSIRMSFSDNQISVNAGCNTLFGETTWKGAQLITSALASTEMGCLEELHAQDTLLADLLEHAPTIDLTDTTLAVTGTAHGDSVGITLVELQDAPLTGTEWVLSGLATQDAVASLPAGVTPTLVIEDGNAVIAYGCNRGNAEVTITEDTLAFGPLASTRMMCEPDAMDVEQHVMAVLDGEVTYQVELNSLVITNGDLGLHYTANG